MSNKDTNDIYRCLEPDCGETFSHKQRAADHARTHFPTIGNYGIYDFIEIIPEYERPTVASTEQGGVQ